MYGCYRWGNMKGRRSVCVAALLLEEEEEEEEEMVAAAVRYRSRYGKMATRDPCSSCVAALMVGACKLIGRGITPLIHLNLRSLPQGNLAETVSNASRSL